MSDRNVADDNTDVVNRLFAQAKEDAGESFPEWAGPLPAFASFR